MEGKGIGGWGAGGRGYRTCSSEKAAKASAVEGWPWGSGMKARAGMCVFEREERRAMRSRVEDWLAVVREVGVRMRRWMKRFWCGGRGRGWCGGFGGWFGAEGIGRARSWDWRGVSGGGLVRVLVVVGV